MERGLGMRGMYIATPIELGQWVGYLTPPPPEKKPQFKLLNTETKTIELGQWVGYLTPPPRKTP